MRWLLVLNADYSNPFSLTQIMSKAAFREETSEFMQRHLFLAVEPSLMHWIEESFGLYQIDNPRVKSRSAFLRKLIRCGLTEFDQEVMQRQAAAMRMHSVAPQQIWPNGTKRI